MSKLTLLQKVHPITVKRWNSRSSWEQRALPQMFAEAGCTGSDTWICWFGRVSEYFWRLHFPVTKVIFKTLKTSGDIWWPTVWRAALQRALLHCEAITPPHSASDAVCCCCFETHTSFYCLCKDERKNFLHHCLINELASSDPDIIDPCGSIISNPNPTLKVAFLWIPDIVLEFLKEMLDEEYGFWKKQAK